MSVVSIYLNHREGVEGYKYTGEMSYTGYTHLFISFSSQAYKGSFFSCVFHCKFVILIASYKYLSFSALKGHLLSQRRLLLFFVLSEVCQYCLHFFSKGNNLSPPAPLRRRSYQ